MWSSWLVSLVVNCSMAAQISNGGSR